MITFGSLFTGIGGIDLGLERAGISCAWQVEIDPFCRKVLNKHWPTVPKFDDITKTKAAELSAVDVIAGGFPCQDVSQAGTRSGINGKRSRLWEHFARLVRELLPKVVLVENTPGLITRGIDRVLGQLAECGYNAQWQSLSAAAVGAPHIRDRVFIIGTRRAISNTDGTKIRNERKRQRQQQSQPRPVEPRNNGQAQSMADTDGRRREQGRQPQEVGTHKPRRKFDGCSPNRSNSAWQTEPSICRVAYGLPNKLDRNRLKALGNAVVPQCAELIARRYVLPIFENAEYCE